MKELIVTVGNELRVSHRVIAENTNNEQRSIRLLIDENMSDFEEFGQVSFEMTTVKNSVGATNEQKTYFLNEQQSTLLVTYLRNNEIVRKFKVALVKEFYNLRNVLKVETELPSLPFASQEMNLKDKKLRKAFYKAFGGKCYYTKKKLHVDNFHIDHIMPRSLGGADTLSNLVLCDPSENSRKLNSYDKSFVEHHQAIVVKDFAPLVYAIYISNQGSLVAPGINPTALLTAPMMTKMEKMFGFEATRDFYAKLIPGIELKAIKKRERDNIDAFINDCIREYPNHKSGFFTSIHTIVDAYNAYCEKNHETAVNDRAIRTQLKKRCETATTYKATIDGKRVRCLTVELVD
jgi:phage regulator Rha-like protein